MLLNQNTSIRIAEAVIESMRENVIPYHFLDAPQQRAITLLSPGGFPFQVEVLDQEKLEWVSLHTFFPPGGGSTYADQRFAIFRLVGDV